MDALQTTIACAALALCFAIVAGTTWYDHRRQREENKRLSAARQARIAELRAARIIREKRHERRSEIDREIALLVARSLSHE